MKPALFVIVCALGLSACGKKEEAAKESPPPPVKKPLEQPAPEDVQKLKGELKRMDPEEAKFIAVPNTPPEVKKAVKPEAPPQLPPPEVRKPSVE